MHPGLGTHPTFRGRSPWAARCLVHPLLVDCCYSRPTYGRIRPAIYSAGWSPVGGGKVGHWKWPNTSFSRAFWKSIPAILVGNEKAEAFCLFQTSKPISVEMTARGAGGNGTVTRRPGSSCFMDVIVGAAIRRHRGYASSCAIFVIPANDCADHKYRVGW